jgi:hypothetical protein
MFIVFCWYDVPSGARRQPGFWHMVTMEDKC